MRGYQKTAPRPPRNALGYLPTFATQTSAFRLLLLAAAAWLQEGESRGADVMLEYHELSAKSSAANVGMCATLPQERSRPQDVSDASHQPSAA